MKFSKNISFVTKEIFSNMYLIQRLSAFAFFKQNRDAKLGMLWNILTPSTNILTYWLVFGIGLRTGSPKNNIPALPWLICGVCPWYFISQSISRGSNSIFRKSGVAAKIKFPLSVIPISEIFTLLYTHIIVLFIAAIVVLANGVPMGLLAFQTLYYMLCALSLMVALSVLTSAISAVNRDFHNLLHSLVRLLFLTTPILWSIDRMQFPPKVLFIFKLNPVYYIIDGYRESLLYGEALWLHPVRTAYFWAFTLTLYFVGCNVHVVFRRKFNSM